MATVEHVVGAGADLPEKEPTEVIKSEEPREEGPAAEPGMEEEEGNWPEDKYEEKLPEHFMEDEEEDQEEEEGDIESRLQEEKPTWMVDVDEDDDDDGFASVEKDGD
ncbi:hypothetical protein SAY86_020865 [Trapa natans]|uniref:Uncharacterized protein n=1 Tax=Trapa natans TaxID=22666 RepID=A0AAN7MY60_TRANT|nr:hypothetical protein SAY86_020865 [Trapa natans]